MVVFALCTLVEYGAPKGHGGATVVPLFITVLLSLPQNIVDFFNPISQH